MIKYKKILNPILGVVIGISLNIFAMFGIIFLFGDTLNEGQWMLMILPFVFVGTAFLVFNASFFGLKRLAKKIDESAAKMNPVTFINSSYIICKVRNLFLVKSQNHYFHIVRMNEEKEFSPSWLRKFLSPELLPKSSLKSPIIADFQGFPIRKLNGEIKMYDPEEERWFQGMGSRFTIFFLSQPMSTLLHPDIIYNLINLIDQLE